MGVAKRERTLYARALMFGGYFRYRHIAHADISAIGPKGLNDRLRSIGGREFQR